MLGRDYCFCVAVSVLDGAYFVRIADETIRVAPGQTVVIAEHIPHDIWVETMCRLSYAHFSCRMFSLDALRCLPRGWILLPNAVALPPLERMNRAAKDSAGALCRRIDLECAVAALASAVLHTQPEQYARAMADQMSRICRNAYKRTAGRLRNDRQVRLFTDSLLQAFLRSDAMQSGTIYSSAQITDGLRAAAAGLQRRADGRTHRLL